MQVADGIHRFGSRMVSWYVLTEGGRLTVVDAGMPAHWRQLKRALGRLGRGLGDVEAVVLTHAHADHTGFAERARRKAAAPVHVHAGDAAGGARRFPSPKAYRRPSSWPLAIYGLVNGLPLTPRVKRFETFEDGARLDVPGRPVVLHTPGHTAGSCALYLPDSGALLCGDALVTYDPYTRRRGPRLLVDDVNQDPAETRASLDRLASVPATLLLPGHGEPWHGTAADACARARQDATSPASGGAGRRS